MDAALVPAALIAAALLLAWAAHGARDRPGLLWGGAWAAVLGAGCVLLVDPEGLGPRGVAVLGPLTPGFELAGALALARGRAPAWVVPCALLLGLARVAPGVLPAGVDSWLAVAVEPAGSLAAAVVVLGVVRRERSGLTLALVPPLLSALALVDALSAGSRLFADGLSGPLVVGWFALAAVGIPLQLHAAGEGRARSQRRRAEASLRESQERFRALTENAFDLVAELDGDERFTYVNPRYQEVLGHAPEALLGHRPAEYLHRDDLAAAAAFASQAARDGTASGLVLRARHRDGRWIWLESAARSFVLPGGERRWVMSSRDVSERRLVEQTRERVRERLEETVAARTHALQASETRFRVLADHAPELIAEFDDRGRYLFANAAFRDLLGREPWDLIGTSPEALIHPDDLARSRRSMARAMRREGTSHALHRLRHADGSWRWFDNTGRAYRTAEGDLRFVSIGRDVTEVRRAETERRRLEAHMQEVQRLESLGVLAGGIAHDFNNLLAVILGNTALLASDAGGEAHRAIRLRRIGAAARHAQGLTEQMLTYAGRSVGKLLPLDLSNLVRETEDLLRAAVAKPVRLELELADGLPQVAADATQMRQVLLNLVTNASEALGEEGGTIRVRTALRHANPAWLTDAFGSAERGAGPWVELEVGDDGPGIDEEVRRRIFEPFYSTKRSGRGLGLASVLGIASAHRGLVVLESEPGEGTRFHLLVPPDTRVCAEGPRTPAATRVPRETATVLVVDDEDAVREVAQVFLERAGLRVVPASGGREAVDLLAEDPSIDTVVLDLGMPDLSGPETLRLLREARPGIPVVIASGYGHDLAAEHLGDARGVAFVAKPYGPEALTAALAEASRGPEDGASTEPPAGQESPS